MSRWARNVDTTHGAIRDALRKCGYGVIDCSRMGSGFPDLLVHARGRTILVECKTSRNKRGTVEPKRIEQSQYDFMREWMGDIVVMATTPEAAVAAVQLALNGGVSR